MKRIISAAAAAVMLTGCAAGDGSSAENSSAAKTAEKTELVWMTGADMPYQDDLNDYLASAGYNFYIKLKTITNDFESIFDGKGKLTEDFWTGCYRAELIAALDEGADSIDTSCWFENSYLSYAEKGLLEPLGQYLESERGEELYSYFPRKYWQNLTYNSEIYGVDSWLNCLQSDISFYFNSEIAADMTVEDLGGDCFSALDKAAELCRENGAMFVIQSLDALANWVDYDFVTSCIYIDDSGRTANIYESEFAEKLFEKIAKYYNSGEFVNDVEVGSKLPDEVLGETHSTVAAECYNGFMTSEDFGISTMVDNFGTLRLANSAHTKLTANVPVTGIYSGSENKEQAFEAICAFMCDSEFINTLNYGAGYTETDGCASYSEYCGIPMGNVAEMLPIEGMSPANIGKKKKDSLAGKQVSRYSEFSFNAENVQKEIIDIYNLTLNINDDFLKRKTDDTENAAISAKEYLDELNASLYAADLQDVLDEVDRQLEEYNETHDTDN